MIISTSFQGTRNYPKLKHNFQVNQRLITVELQTTVDIISHRIVDILHQTWSLYMLIFFNQHLDGPPIKYLGLIKYSIN